MVDIRAGEDGRAYAVASGRAIVPWAMLGLLALVTASVPAVAQHNWWESVPGFGSPSYTDPRAERSQRKTEEVDDLRTNAVPWRSDEMLMALDDAIARYQKLVSIGGWPRIPDNRLMRPGDDDERVPILRRRLRISGDLAASTGYFEDYGFDQRLEDAVRKFQARNGLRVTGRADRPTIAALNVSAQDRLEQLRLNRNRLAELLRQPIEDRYILVNVPAFQLEAVERFEVQQRHRVIVGRTERQTPEIRATIKGLNFFPYWRVPDSVAQLDLIPRMMKEPDYLTKEKIRVFNGFNGPELDPTTIDWSTADASKLKFKQDPGDQNALGLVRIDMPNEQTVYMHDTPMKNLFSQRGRAFSAGCVRVQNVFDLVDWIARHEIGWETAGRAREVVDGGQALDLVLTRPIPVHFVYITAWAEPDGTVHFRPDLYNRDGYVELAAGRERDPNDPSEPPLPMVRALAP